MHNKNKFTFYFRFMRLITISILFLLPSISWASFPIEITISSEIKKPNITIEPKRETIEKRYWKYKTKKRFLPNWKIWQKALLIFFGSIIALIILAIIWMLFFWYFESI